MEISNKMVEPKEKSIKEYIFSYLRYWYVFVIAVIIALVGAFIYLRYTTPLYQTQATIVIKDDKTGGELGGLTPFSNIGNFSSFGRNLIDDELAIFRSKRIVTEAVRNLKLNISYQTIGTIITSENYEYRPFVVQYVSFADSLRSSAVPRLFFQIESDTEFTVSDQNQTFERNATFGERLQLPFGDIIVIPLLDNAVPFSTYFGSTIVVTHKPVEEVALSYQNRFQVINEKNFSTVVKLTMQSAVPKKSEDFLNELIFQYNKDAINDKNQIAQKTSNFIDDRLDIITSELDSVERSKEVFKSDNRLTDIQTEAQIILENASEFNKKQLDVGTQLELANTMVDYMQNSAANDLLPANIGLEGEELANSVSNYNQLILERNRLLKSSTPQNPVVGNINAQIEQIRSGILSSLQNTANGLKVALRDLNYQQSSLNSKISQVPTKEKLFRGIERQQTIKEQLYLFLLQQREEASISLAVTSPKAKVIDPAYSSKTPVSPKKTIVYLAAIVLGLLIPFLALYVIGLLDTKVKERSDVERALPNTKLLGEIPRLDRSADQLVGTNDRSILAESFRILRTNVQYLLATLEKPKRIFVTSTIKGEGKTFVAFNYALTLALTGKRVVLVGADIRNPQLHRYLPNDKESKKGLTEFIVDDTLNATDLAMESGFNKNLDIILSGAIPPNPAELLMQSRVGNFLTELEAAYDYVIVDTAPSMLVTDTLLISKHADLTLYVIRAGYTEKALMEFLQDVQEDGRLENVATVLNGVAMNNFGYGNKYGYSYSNEQPSKLKKLFGR